MKKLWVFTGIILLFFIAMSDNAFSSSAENRRDCENWCNNNKPDCEFCNSNRTCGGRELSAIKSFKRGTGWWYACGKKNKIECEDWCNKNKPTCIECASDNSCGCTWINPCYKRVVKSFRGPGENWYACSDVDNETACNNWCNRNRPPCFHCSTHRDCDGSMYEQFKSFTRSGNNWYACRLETNMVNCQEWCDQNKPRCVRCSPHKGCGRGYKEIENFKGPGDNWYACERR